MCIQFGPRFNVDCAELTSLYDGALKWVNSCRYLGVYLESERSLKFSFSNAKASFYRAFNAMYGKIGRLALEDTILQLLRAKCMPVLLYATEVCQMLSRDKQSLEFTLTRLFMKLFRTASPTVVIECQCNFCFLLVALQIQIRTARFLQVFTATENSLCLLFYDNAVKQ